MITLEVACERFATIQEVMNTIANRGYTDARDTDVDIRNIAKSLVDICYTMRQLYDLTGGFPHGEGKSETEQTSSGNERTREEDVGDKYGGGQGY